MSPQVAEKLNSLRQLIRGFGSALVAYSGGVDSAVVMAVAQQELGEKALACMGVSPSYPTREMRDAQELAERLGVKYRTIDTEEHLRGDYSRNDENRCFYCKSELYDRIMQIRDQENWGAVLDGNNASDISDDRPGALAGHQRGVRSPLQECGITKAQVRLIAAELGLDIWDKPAMACLSSRVPRGTPITPQLLKQIELAEDVLAELGFRQFRVRHHGEIARIELPSADLPRAVQLASQILDGVRSAGYRYVALDLAGFREESDLAEATEQLVPLNVSVKP